MWWTGQRDFSEESGLRAGGAMRKLRFGGLVEHFHFGSEKPLKILNKSSHPEWGEWEGRAVPRSTCSPSGPLGLARAQFSYLLYD